MLETPKTKPAAAKSQVRELAKLLEQRALFNSCAHALHAKKLQTACAKATDDANLAQRLIELELELQDELQRLDYQHYRDKADILLRHLQDPR